MKQLGIAMAQYLGDYDSTYPVWSNLSFNSSNGTGSSWFDDYYNNASNASEPFWLDEMQPYLKSTQITVCPSQLATHFSDFADKGACGTACNGLLVSGYALSIFTLYNPIDKGSSFWTGVAWEGNASTWQSATWNVVPTRESQIVNSTRAMIVEAIVGPGPIHNPSYPGDSSSSFWTHGDRTFTTSIAAGYDNTDGGGRDMVAADRTALPGPYSSTTSWQGLDTSRHLGTTNVLYFDGHVKALPAAVGGSDGLASTTTTFANWLTDTNSMNLWYPY